MLTTSLSAGRIWSTSGRASVIYFWEEQKEREALTRGNSSEGEIVNFNFGRAGETVAAG